MKKLKIILLSNWMFYLIFFFSLLYCLIQISIPTISKYLITDNIFECIIDDMFIDGNYLSIRLIGKEKLQANYYFKTEKEKNEFIRQYKLGDKMLINGSLSIPSKNTNPNLFNYKKYLYNEGIHYILNIKEYKKIINNPNFIYQLKSILIEKIESFTQSSPYLYALILGDDRYLNEEVINSYQKIGISHLFAISGMHISILSGVLLFLFRKLHFNEKISYLLVILFLLIYLFITGYSPSILRSVVLFLLLSINKLFKLNIKTFNMFLLTISLIIIIEPFIIFKVGFQFSSIVSGTLILFSFLINKYKYYITKLLMTSFIAFLVGVPISINNFYQINVLSFIYNLFFVPLMTFILFPLTLITFIFPFLENVLLFVIDLMEKSSKICSLIPSILIFKKTILIVVVIYYIIVFLIFINWNRNKKYLVIFVLTLLIHHNYNFIFRSRYTLFLDVGQGDSILLHYDNKNILIDTGGLAKYNEEKWSIRLHKNSIASAISIPILKSFGIAKIDYLILTHGDYDHMGEAINLVQNFKVEKAIFNCGEFNELEQDLIKVLDKKKIPYYSCIKELNIDDNKLYFLNNKEYGNENDNSSVIYIKLNNHKFLFMGDAGLEVEEDLIEKYNLQDIDVLKVGHHGSKTSSGKEFIDVINPKYSIISVGENNRYGHPNKEVIDNLEDSKIYRTDQDGSIMFRINKDKLKIETCVP